MLELLLRLLGLKKRRRRVYAQPPMPPGAARREAGQRPAQPTPQAGAPASLRSSAEAQTAEQAQKLLRERAARNAPGLARLPVVGFLFKPARKRSGTVMPLPPGQAQTRRATEEDLPTPEGRARRPRRLSLAKAWHEIKADIGRKWAGRPGAVARRTAWVLLIYVAPAVAVAVPSYLVVEEMRAIGVEVQPISVPASVARSGRTPDVLARLLIDQVAALQRRTLLDRADRWPQDIPVVQPPWALASANTPLHRIAVWLRGLTLQPARTVSGAVTELPDGRLSVQLYVSGMNRGAPVAGLDAFSSDALNSVLAGAAPLLLRAISPRVYAWYIAGQEARPSVLQEQLRGLLTDPASGSVDTATRNTVDFLLARGLARTGRTDEAMAAADALIKRAPTYPPGYYARAIALQMQNDTEGALAAAEQARKADGGHAWSYKVLCSVYLSAHRFADALAAIDTALRLDPNDGSAIVLQADTLLAMRRMDEAVAAVRNGMERAPGQPGLMEAGAAIMLSRGRPDIAIGLINNELRQNPQRVDSLVFKARLLSAMGKATEALQAADAALRLQPTNGMAQTARGYALVAARRPSEALALFDKLIAAAPDNPTVLQGRALALAEAGRKPEAIEAFQKVLELAPDFLAARRELARLQGRPLPLPSARPHPAPQQPAPAQPGAAPSAPAAPQAAKPARPAANGNFVAPALDVGPAPAPAIPRAESGTLPMSPGGFTAPPGAGSPQFRRPDSEEPKP